jgi:hypothetical protein
MLTCYLVASLTLAPANFPRVANLWGANPGAADVETWGRYDLLVTAGGSPAQLRAFRAAQLERNPDSLLLDTGPLMNLSSPAAMPWLKEEWLLRRPDGSPIRWWADQVYTPLITNDECLAAIVEQTAQPYGELLADGTLSGMFYDSVVGAATWLGEVDADRDGVADRASDINPRWQAAQCRFFDTLASRWPGMLIMANDIDPGHRAHVNGRLFEGATLLDRVANGSGSPDSAIRTLNEWMAESKQHGITFALMSHPLGWQGWRVGQGSAVSTKAEVDRVRRDYPRMRLGLLTTLMTDAYYAYDFGTVWYGLPLWYAEYDAPLGQALGPARQVYDVPPQTVYEWHAGEATNGLVLDAPTRAGAGDLVAEVVDPAAGWARLWGTDPAVVRFEPGRTYEVEFDCEITTAASGTFQFNLRTAKGGWEHHDKGIEARQGPSGSAWRIRATVVPDDFDDYSAEVHLSGSGAIRLSRVKVTEVGAYYWRRDFEGGVALLNGLARPVSVTLDSPLRRLKDAEAPAHIVEMDDSDAGFERGDGFERVSDQGHFMGDSYRIARKPGATARWRVVAPSTGEYTLYALTPKLEGLTDSAAYRLACGPVRQTGVIDQRPGEGGWTPVLTAALETGQAVEVTVVSGGAGLTAADAIRLESRARLNDGSRVSEITLPPADGALLLREKP